MTGQLVLITVGTGHVGFRTVVEALSHGYSVRAAVRTEAGISKIKAAESIQPYLEHLTFVLVPDIEQEDAYNDAVKGVDLIIHLASPIPFTKEPPTVDQYDSHIVQPAVKGTLNMLRAAKSYSPTTHRIVITTSVVAQAGFAEFFSQDNTVYDEQSRVPTPTGPFDAIFPAYFASKAAALNAAEEWMKTSRPRFDLNHISPAFVVGKNELEATPEDIVIGSNAAAFGHVLGMNPGPTPSLSVHVNDIAKMHVLALSPKIAGNQLFIGVSENSNTRWENSFDIVRKYFPEAVADGTFPLTGENPTLKVNFDNSWTQKTLGMEFVGYEEQVRSVAEHYLELKRAQQPN